MQNVITIEDHTILEPDLDLDLDLDLDAVFDKACFDLPQPNSADIEIFANSSNVTRLSPNATTPKIGTGSGSRNAATAIGRIQSKDGSTSTKGATAEGLAAIPHQGTPRPGDWEQILAEIHQQKMIWAGGHKVEKGISRDEAAEGRAKSMKTFLVKNDTSGFQEAKKKLMPTNYDDIHGILSFPYVHNRPSARAMAAKETENLYSPSSAGPAHHQPVQPHSSPWTSTNPIASSISFSNSARNSQEMITPLFSAPQSSSYTDLKPLSHNSSSKLASRKGQLSSRDLDNTHDDEEAIIKHFGIKKKASGSLKAIKHLFRH